MTAKANDAEGDADAPVSFANLRSRFEAMSATPSTSTSSLAQGRPIQSPTVSSSTLAQSRPKESTTVSPPSSARTHTVDGSMHKLVGHLATHAFSHPRPQVPSKPEPSSSSLPAPTDALRQKTSSLDGSGEQDVAEPIPPIPQRPFTPASPEALRQRYPGAMEALRYAESDDSAQESGQIAGSSMSMASSAPATSISLPAQLPSSNGDLDDRPPPVPNRPTAEELSVVRSPTSMQVPTTPHPSSAPSSGNQQFNKPLPHLNGTEERRRSTSDTRPSLAPPLPPSTSATLLPPPRRSHAQHGLLSHLARSASTSASHSPQNSGSSSPLHSDSAELDGIDSSESDVENDVTQAIGTANHQVSVRLSDQLPDVTRANRRPPHYAPPRIVSPKGHIACLAVRGDAVIVGHHDRLREYNSSRLNFDPVVHQLSLDNDLREIKVIALAFRPSLDPKEDGRYLWCGTKEGDLIEFDMKESRITSHRVNAHTAPVTLLKRVGSNMISVDESGKICTWLANRGGREGSSSGGGMVSLKETPVSQRIVMDKYSVPMMLGDELWIASAGEQSGAASRSSKVRIYRPFCVDKPFNAVSRPVTIPDTLTGGLQVGLISSGTIVPLDPTRIYLGHQSGHISIWNRTTYACVAVYPTGTAGVTKMCGVRGWHLWVGGRNGEISIFDVREAPWEVVKRWRPQKNAAVTELDCDPSGIDKGSLQVYSASLEGDACVWDGLLTSDWMTHELERRLIDYSSLHKMAALQVTFNIDAASPLDFEGRETPGLDQLNDGMIPDLIIIGFQELVDLQDTRIMAKKILLGGARRSRGHDVGERLSHQARAWTQKIESDLRKRVLQLDDANKKTAYKLVLQDSLVGLYTAVFVRESTLPSISHPAIASIKTGFGGRIGNKGAIIASLRIDDTPIAWINCHLAAGQHHTRQRNADLVNVFDSLPFSERVARMASGAAALRHEEGAANQEGTVVELFAGGGDGEMILPDHEIVFLAGDLNYRIDLRRDQCFDLINKANWPALLARDQLARQLRDNNTHRLRPFNEAEITFAPTYKFDRRTSTYDTSEKQRVPAYCDRILWYSRTQSAHSIQCDLYTSDARPVPSDHRPVIGRFSFQTRRADPERRAATLDELGVAWKVAQAERLRSAREFYFGTGTKSG